MRSLWSLLILVAICFVSPNLPRTIFIFIFTTFFRCYHCEKEVNNDLHQPSHTIYFYLLTCSLSFHTHAHTHTHTHTYIDIYLYMYIYIDMHMRTPHTHN